MVERKMVWLLALDVVWGLCFEITLIGLLFDFFGVSSGTLMRVAVGIILIVNTRIVGRRTVRLIQTLAQVRRPQGSSFPGK